jgi:hypothetical protein
MILVGERLGKSFDGTGGDPFGISAVPTGNYV